MNEEWRYIDGFPGYEVSNLGRVRKKKITGEGYGYPSIYHPIVVKNSKLLGKRSEPWYPQVSIRNAEGVQKRINVHRLVAKAFLPPVEGKPQVNHKDGNKANSKLENLEWVDNSGNQKHAFSTGLRVCPVRGENNPVGKLTAPQIREILSLKGKLSQNEIARRFGINQSNVSRIFSKEKWGWLESQGSDRPSLKLEDLLNQGYPSISIGSIANTIYLVRFRVYRGHRVWEGIAKGREGSPDLTVWRTENGKSKIAHIQKDAPVTILTEDDLRRVG